MKTLNKTLSLVLALVMVFSLFGVASAAQLSDFTDKGDVTYTEAVDYLTAAGVIAGETATTINPKGNFTREQAAKLVAYACLGQAAADAMKAPAAPFSDVEADRWSAGYIAYCVNAGIINGMGDGSFAPTAEVTGYQMAKMLLGALGYGVNNEFTGANWKLEVAKLALAKDIFYGNTAGASDVAATREEAFLYTFNGLTNAMLVKYNSSLAVYYSGTNPFENNQTFDDANTIGVQRFKMDYTATSNGSKGEACHYWAIDGKKVTGNYANKAVTVLAKSADGTAYANLITDSKTSYIGYEPDDSAETLYYYNGTNITAETTGTTPAVAQGKVDTKGVEVSFIDTDKDGKYNTVSIVENTLAKVAAAPTVKTEGKVTIVTVPGVTGLNEVNADNVTGYEGLVKGDYVMYHTNIAGTRFTLEKCDSKTGKIFGYNEVGCKINFNGTNVDVTEIASADSVTEIVGAGLVGVDNVTAYTDANGYIVKVISTDETVALSNFVYIAEASDPSVTMTVTAKAVFSDGSSATINVAKAPATLAGTTIVANQQPEAGFYTYTKDSNNAYSLKAIPSTYSQNNTITKIDSGKAVFSNVAGILATSDTNFVIAKTSGYTLYKGITKVPNVTSITSTESAILYVNDGSYAKFVVATDGDATASNSSDYAFITLPVSMNYLDADNPYEVYYSTVINGEIKDVNAVYGAGLAAGTLYEVQGYDDGKVSDVETSSASNLIHDFATPSQTSANIANSFTYSGTTLTAKLATYTVANVVLADDCKVFLYDATKATPTIVASSKEELASLATNKMYQIQGLEKSTSDESISQLFVTIIPDANYCGLAAAPTATVDGNVASVTGTATPYSVNVVVGDAAKALTVSATASAAAFGATVTYSADGIAYAAALPATNTGAAGATKPIYIKVAYGSASVVYTVNFVTAAS